jgi:cytosine/adenosine deaminase-related metal-dependent hydrolase
MTPPADSSPVADLLVRDARLVVTMKGPEIPGGFVAVRNGLVTAVGPAGSEPPARRVLDAGGCLVTPGLINTHHHMLQNLTRNFKPENCSRGREAWILPLQKIWERLDEESAYLSAWIAMAELLLGGCTTTSDHLNNHPRPHLIDAEIKAAREIGIRFHPTRGCMDLSCRHGFGTPDSICQDRDTILADCERLVSTHHDRSHGAMVRIALAPCNPFAVSPELLTEAAALAEKLDVRLHTHLAEGPGEEEFCLRTWGCRPVERLECVGWTRDRTWVAHATWINDEEIRRLGAAGVGVAHCPSSNLLSARAIAPVAKLRAAGCPVGIGCDGGASAGHGSLWMETRTAMQVGHLAPGPRITARDALEMATLGSAACLGRQDELGHLAVGAAGDLVVWPTDTLYFSGMWSDLVEAWLRDGPVKAKHTIVAGRVLVQDGELQLREVEAKIRQHHALAREWQRAALEL